jgi:predicted phage tail protein
LLLGIGFIALAVVVLVEQHRFAAGQFTSGAVVGVSNQTATFRWSILQQRQAILVLHWFLAVLLKQFRPSLKPSSLDESVQLESFTFSNVVNTSKQGLPVPIAYGRVFAGSAVLSSSLDVDQKQA